MHVEQNNADIRTFVTVWFGQLVSIVGSGMTDFALGLYVYQRTQSVTQFALILLCRALAGPAALARRRGAGGSLVQTQRDAVQRPHRGGLHVRTGGAFRQQPASAMAHLRGRVGGGGGGRLPGAGLPDGNDCAYPREASEPRQRDGAGGAGLRRDHFAAAGGVVAGGFAGAGRFTGRCRHVLLFRLHLVDRALPAHRRAGYARTQRRAVARADQRRRELYSTPPGPGHVAGLLRRRIAGGRHDRCARSAARTWLHVAGGVGGHPDGCR